MSALNDLLGIKKEKSEARASEPEAASVQQKEIEKPKGFALNLGVKPMEEEKPNGQLIADHDIETESKRTDDPFAGLADSLSNISFDEPAKTEQQPAPDQQFQNPTLDDISKFVFEEQPDQSTEEIAESFSQMLDELSESMGDQVPANLAKNLKFIKEHSFLADILKPESISVLVTAMRKSYGFVVQNKSEKAVKKAKQNEKVSKVLDDLGSFSF